MKLHELLVKERSAKGQAPRGMTDRFGFSMRESEVVAQALGGLSDQQIATKLNVSLSTVKKHLHNAYRKAGVGSRSQLAALMRK